MRVREREKLLIPRVDFLAFNSIVEREACVLKFDRSFRTNFAWKFDSLNQTNNQRSKLTVSSENFKSHRLSNVSLFFFLVIPCDIPFVEIVWAHNFILLSLSTSKNSSNSPVDLSQWQFEVFLFRLRIFFNYHEFVSTWNLIPAQFHFSRI